MREVEGHPYSIIQWHCWKGRRALQKCFNVKWENLAWIIKECSFDQFCNIVWKSITLKNWNLNGKISLLLYPSMIYVLYTFQLFSTMTKTRFFIELKYLHYYSTLSAISQFQSVSKNLGCNLLFHWNPICLVMSEQLSWQAFRDLLKLLCSII